MLTNLRIQGFKSWADTGEIKLGKLTGFFGTNSSGKTSLLQFLLMLKQTAESNDRSRVLHTGDQNSYVDLGSFYDIAHQHKTPSRLQFSLTWSPSDKSKEHQTDIFSKTLDLTGQDLSFACQISVVNHGIFLEKFTYSAEGFTLEVQRTEKDNFRLKTQESGAAAQEENRTYQPGLISNFYGIPHGARIYTNLDDLSLSLDTTLKDIYYLGPLREYPSRIYSWGGSKPADVGKRGEYTVEALLSADKEYRLKTLAVTVAEWLKRLELIEEFSLRPIAQGRQEYEVRVRKTAESAEVALTDVGFGVSQVLPVLVLCFYAPEGSTIIFEQPEIHLHPAVQAGLADVFLDAIKQRNVQIILESHSEHLLHRLQRRIAEEEIPADDVNLYFTEMQHGASKLTALDLDEYGNIRNWPKGFFGDEIGDLVQMTQAAMKRKKAERDAK